MNKRFLFLAFLAAGAVRADDVDIASLQQDSVGPAASTAPVPAPPPPPPVRFVHPKEGMSLPAVRRSFAYGWAEPGGRLTLNGAPVDVHPGGGWLALVDYAPGPNLLSASYEKDGVSFSLERSVTVAGGGWAASPGPESLRPDEDQGVAPGELVAVSFRAPSGGKGHFHVQGLKAKFPMEEAGGLYRGFFAPPAGTSFNGAAVTVEFEGKGGKKYKKKAPGRVTVVNPERPWVVEVSTDLAILRAGPDFTARDLAGYLMFPPPGVRLRVTGFQGGSLRVRLSRDRDLWIGRGDVRDLPAGTSPPQAVTYGVTVQPGGLVRMALSQKVPFEVSPSEDLKRIEVRFFGAFSNTDWIHLLSDDPRIKQVRWFQETSEVFLLSVETDGSWWGYDARYEGGAFMLEVRRPGPARNPKFPLEGLVVAVDAGHSPDTGAVGVTGSLEKDVNLAIAERLKAKLLAEKAAVTMVREGDASVLLYDRPKSAWASKADVLISVHNNALPEGENPFEKRGFGIYYYHPQSLALARETYRAYEESFLTGRNALKAVLPGDGLHWGNLALPRTPQMPAILTESAYMIHPEEEYWLRQPQFQEACAEAMLEGLKRWVRKARPSR